MPLSDFSEAEREQIIMKLLRLMPISVAQAACCLFPSDHEAYGKERAENVLDDIWDMGLCYNAGEFQDYRYLITPKGKEYLCAKPAIQP